MFTHRGRRFQSLLYRSVETKRTLIKVVVDEVLIIFEEGQAKYGSASLPISQFLWHGHQRLPPGTGRA
jgi:hypothetical protein